MGKKQDINWYWRVISQIVSESDIILEILDARLPELSRNEQLERIVAESGKEIIFVVNKTDLVSDKYLDKVKKDLGKEHACFYLSAKEKLGTKRLRDMLYQRARKYVAPPIPKEKELTNQQKRERPRHFFIHWGKFKVGIIGYPNSGKSSIINALLFKNKAKVSKKAGTTHGIQWMSAGERLLILDSPGVIPLETEDEVRDALIGARDVAKIKDLPLSAFYIIRLFEDEFDILEKYYDIKIESDDPGEIIEVIGKRKGFLSKGGEIDENRVSAMIIRDWQEGKLKL
jgi:hypothetical protein